MTSRLSFRLSSSESSDDGFVVLTTSPSLTKELVLIFGEEMEIELYNLMIVGYCLCRSLENII